MSRLLPRRVALLLGALALVVLGGLAANPVHAAPPGDGGGVITPDIVGGGYATTGRPWIAALHNNGSFTCTSSQISASWILTAAHCVPNNSGYSVRIGSLNRSSGGTVRTIDQVARHPGFNWPAYDIALLHMSQPFANSYAPMAKTSADFAVNQAATVYGWGSEHADWSGPLPERLKFANGYVSSTSCASSVMPAICTQTNGSVAGGDSGGPAIVLSPVTGTYLLSGVCAVGHKPAGSGWAAYTPIFRHWSWIAGVTGL
ncbi:serine protease [Phytomonospora sp. NPDC050363]|uniref:S1 family peptidase n=1 Tax=Phytomonospora sp. NPDC050363 TaxID=3155642 RepID=UPI0033F9DC62